MFKIRRKVFQSPLKYDAKCSTSIKCRCKKIKDISIALGSNLCRHLVAERFNPSRKCIKGAQIQIKHPFPNQKNASPHFTKKRELKTKNNSTRYFIIELSFYYFYRQEMILTFN